MKILIDISHPAHVHLFKHFAYEMQKRGHKILFTAREKDTTIELLKHYRFDFISFGTNFKNFLGKIWGVLKFDFHLFNVARKFKPDVFFSHGSLYAAHVAFLLKRPNIFMENTDVDLLPLFNKPFTSAFLTAKSFKKKLGRKHIYYNSIQELAYLHPKYFKPNYEVVKQLGIKNGEKYVLLRFVQWNSYDDYSLEGFSVEEMRNIVKTFSKYAKIFISSEKELPQDLQKYHLEKNKSFKTGSIHDVEYYATLFYGESGAMASECAMLGTPAFYVSKKALGFTAELDKKYSLIFDYRDNKNALKHAISLINTPNPKQQWQSKHQIMLKNKIDLTAFMIWFIENYPESVKIMKENPDYQQKFKYNNE